MQKKMKLLHAVVLLLLLQLSIVLSISNTTCPLPCQCFSATTMICSDSQMKVLPVNIPSQVTALIVIASGLWTITNQEHLGNVNKLVFLNNPVKNVSHGAFKGLTSLEELEISGSYFFTLEAGTFDGLDNLNKLLLNNNRIKLLAPSIFESLWKLETLQLRGNLLQSLHRDQFQKLDNLQDLNLSSNNLSTVDTSNLHKLKKLDLGLNKITSLNTFSGNPQLKILSLQGNQITRLTQSIFSHLQNLEELNLRDNMIESLYDGLFPSNLKKLTLRGNSLIHLSLSAFTGLHNLTHLDLSQNQLDCLPAEIFHNLSSLEHLDLSGNRLQQLASNVFKGLQNINVIDLQKNKLASLDADLFQDQVLMSRLNLASNQLENLPNTIFDLLDFECLLQLSDNPWRCDCNLTYFHGWLNFFNKSVEDLSQVYCTNPQHLRGTILTAMAKEQLFCEKEAVTTSSDSDRQCSLQEVNGAIVVKCTITKCTDVKLDMYIQKPDGRIFNYSLSESWSESSQCLNKTVILTV